MRPRNLFAADVRSLGVSKDLQVPGVAALVEINEAWISEMEQLEQKRQAGKKKRGKGKDKKCSADSNHKPRMNPAEKMAASAGIKWNWRLSAIVLW